MKVEVGSKVHPRYKGIAEWEVRAIAKLPKPIEWNDPTEGEINYAPKMLWLSCPEYGKVLWFAYWIATSNTKGNLAWGGSPPVLEEDAFLKLLKDAIKQNFFTKNFLKKLNREIEAALSK